MKKNNKGFMLIELIITSTIVVTAMVSLYASFNRIYSLYKTRNNYYNINGIYASKEIVRSLLNGNEFSKIMNANFETGNYSFLIKNGNLNIPISNSTTQEQITEIKDFYKIYNVIITSYSKCILALDECIGDQSNDEEETSIGVESTSLKSEIENETFKDYIEYITKYYNTSSNETYSYIIITELEDGNKYYYSNLGIR